MDNESLFSLIQRRTEERKINWDITSPSKLRGSVPGTDFRAELVHGSDQRDGDWYTLAVTVGGKTVGVGNESQIEDLYDEIMEQDDKDAEAEAREILLSL